MGKRALRSERAAHVGEEKRRKERSARIMQTCPKKREASCRRESGSEGVVLRREHAAMVISQGRILIFDSRQRLVTDLTVYKAMKNACFWFMSF